MANATTLPSAFRSGANAPRRAPPDWPSQLTHTVLPASDVAKIDLRNGGRVGPGRVGLTGRWARERDEASVAEIRGAIRAPELPAGFVDANPSSPSRW
jgi:hypothetical protein